MMWPKSICGDVQVPENPNQGQCSTYRQKRDCEAPVVPPPPCNDSDFDVIYDPDSPVRFRIVAKITGSDCLPILDPSGAPIYGEVN